MTMPSAAPDTDRMTCALAPGCPFEGPWDQWLAHAAEHPLPHPDDRAAWEPARRTFVGASEVAAVCGVNPYDSALDVWAAKVRGQTKRKPHLEGRATARLGHLMEPELLKDYAARHGVQLVRPATRRHPDYPWAGATPDGDSSGGELVQVKMVGANMLHHWIDGPPRYVVLQVQYEMFVWQRDRAVVLAGLGGTDLEEFPLDRDEDLIDSMRQLVEIFWTECVVPRALPTDFDGVASDETLAVLFPRMLAGLVPATEGAVAVARDYADVRERIKPLEAEKEALAQRLKFLVGDAEGFEWPRGKVTWKNAKGSLDKEALIASLFDRLGLDDRARQEMIVQHTPAAGSRRLNVTVKQ